MRTRVQKWGNSLALRIPKSFADEVGIEKETPVDVSMTDGTLIIKPVQQSKLSLKQLLSKVTQENIHSEINTGPTAGIEIW